MLAIDADAALDYLSFVQERHSIWEARQRGDEQPWTEDPILASRKFTNVFRLSDPGSQFVIKELLEDRLDPEEFLLRCFLYRHTNLPAAWEHIRAELGEYPLTDNLTEVELIWQLYRANGGKVFSGAYMVYPQSSVPGTDKVESIIDLTQRLSDAGVFGEFCLAKTQQDRFNILRRNKGVADFMSMQILTDYGYSTEFREDDFVVAGPGARRGTAVLDPHAKAEDVIDWAHETVADMEGQPVLWAPGNRARFLSKMDIQNTFCEFSKYTRHASRPSREQPYKPAHPGVQSAPALPPRWNR